MAQKKRKNKEERKKERNFNNIYYDLNILNTPKNTNIAQLMTPELTAALDRTHFCNCCYRYISVLSSTHKNISVLSSTHKKIYWEML